MKLLIMLTSGLRLCILPENLDLGHKIRCCLMQNFNLLRRLNLQHIHFNTVLDSRLLWEEHSLHRQIWLNYMIIQQNSNTLYISLVKDESKFKVIFSKDLNGTVFMAQAL